MGNNNVRVIIKSEKRLYYTNECVRGSVAINLDDPKQISNVSSIAVSVNGYLNAPGDQRGSRVNILDFFTSPELTLISLEEKKSQITEKHYSWGFTIPLVGYLPPSFNTQVYQLHYFIVVSFKLPWYRSNKYYLEKIYICPHVDLGQIPKEQRFLSNIYKENTNDVMLNARLSKSSFTFGEKIKYQLEIFNTKRLVIKKVQMSLYYKADVQPRRFRLVLRPSTLCNTIYEQTIESIENTNDEMISKTIEIDLPQTYAPPSFVYTTHVPGHFIHCSYILEYTPTISVTYSLKIAATVHNLLRDVVIIVPITLGTIPISNEQESRLAAMNYPNPTDETNICDDRE